MPVISPELGPELRPDLNKLVRLCPPVGKSTSGTVIRDADETPNQTTEGAVHIPRAAGSGTEEAAKSPDLSDLRVGVLGCGAVGTAVGLSLIERVAEVAAWDVNQDHLTAARSMGAVDRIEAGLEGLAGCDVVFICVPPSCVLDAAYRLRLSSDAVLIDVASAKDFLARRVRDPDFVLSHPMRGSNKSGPAAARGDLFRGGTWVVTPHSLNRPSSLQVAETLIRATGAVPVHMHPDVHDFVCARISHFPHILSSAAALTALSSHEAEARLLAGASFRDLTRIARGNPALWTDIAITNKDEIVKCLDDHVSLLQGVRRSLVEGDHTALGNFFDAAEKAMEGSFPSDDAYSQRGKPGSDLR